MQWHADIAELTSAATNLMIALAALLMAAKLKVSHEGVRNDKFVCTIWKWIFLTLALSSGIGALVHGFAFSDQVVFVWLWRLINLTLGITLALFGAACVADVFSRQAALVSLALLSMISGLFFIYQWMSPDDYFVFIYYQATVMLLTLFSFAYLFVRRREPEYIFMAAGIFVSIVGALVQRVESMSVTLFFPLDHNGIYHLIQLCALCILYTGLMIKFSQSNKPDEVVESTEPSLIKGSV